MQPANRDPYSRYSQPPEAPHRSGWKDALLVAAFVLFIFIFVRTGGFFPSARPTPTFRSPPKATVQALRSVTPTPTQAALTPTPTQIVPKLINRHPDIRGAVIEIYTLNDKVTGAYVRGKLEIDTRYTQAFVKFTDKTRLFIKSANTCQLAGLAELARGELVEILFTGPMAQTANNQAVADEIVILK